MKKNMNFFVSDNNTPNLESYTKIIGFTFGSLGINYLIAYLYGKFCVDFKYSAYLLLTGVLMFVLVPIVVTDEKRANRGLFATICSIVMHGICTISIIAMMKIQILIIMYLLEVFIYVLIIIKTLKNKS